MEGKSSQTKSGIFLAKILAVAKMANVIPKCIKRIKYISRNKELIMPLPKLVPQCFVQFSCPCFKKGAQRRRQKLSRV